MSSDPITKFENLVETYRRQEKLSQPAAFAMACRNHPDARRAYVQSYNARQAEIADARRMAYLAKGRR